MCVFSLIQLHAFEDVKLGVQGTGGGRGVLSDALDLEKT